MRVSEAMGSYNLSVFSLPDGRAEAVLREGPKVLMSTYIPKGDQQQQLAAARQKAKTKIAETQATAYAYLNQAQFNAQWRVGDNAKRMTLAKKHPGWAAALLGGQEKLDQFMAGQVWKAVLALTGDPVLAVKIKFGGARGRTS